MKISNLTPKIKNNLIKPNQIKKLALPLAISVATIIGIANSNDKFEKQDNLPKIEEYSQITEPITDMGKANKSSALLILSMVIPSILAAMKITAYIDKITSIEYMEKKSQDKADKRIKSMRKQKVDFNKTNEKGETLLHQYIPYFNDYKGATWGHYDYMKNLEFVKALIKSPEVDINKQDNNGNTPLHIALKGKEIRIVSALLDNPGIDLNRVNKNGESIYSVFMQNLRKIADLDYGHNLVFSHDQIDNISKFLSSPSLNVNMRDKNGNTPLHLATDSHNIDLISTLLKKHKADINLKNNDGDTPLHLAIKNDNTAVVNALLKAPDIDVNIINNDGKDAFDLALDTNNGTIIRNIFNNPKFSSDIKSNIGQEGILDAIGDLFPNTTGLAYTLSKQAAYTKQTRVDDLNKIRKLNLTASDYMKAETYSRIFDCGMTQNGLRLLFNENDNKDKTFKNVLFEYVKNQDILNLNKKDNQTLFEKINRYVSNYDQTDENGISIFEYILNSENSFLLDKMVEKHVQFEYQRAFDYAYNNIQSKEFKDKLDEHKFALVKFNTSTNSDIYKQAVEKMKDSPFYSNNGRL